MNGFVELITAGGNMTVFLQLLLAVVLGMVLGVERTVANKTAGMRTFGLVSMGAALFTIAATSFTPATQTGFNIDPLRVIGGIVSGIGFVGAGLIIFRESKLVGLTTAAGLWVAAGIGVAVGIKLYMLAIFATVLTLIVFTIFWFVEREVKELSDNHIQ